MRNMINNLKKTVGSKLKSLPKRTLAIILSVLVLATTLNLVAIFANASSDAAKNYPALEEFTEGTGISANGKWSYSVRDFAEKALFEVTTDGFDAPLGVWNANDSIATVTWDAVTGADSYTLVIFEGTTKLYTIDQTATQWVSNTTQPLEGGKTYEMQVIAKASGQKIAASKIRIFKAVQPTIITPQVINDFSSDSDLSNISTSYSGAATNKETIGISNNQFYVTTNTNRSSTRVYLKETVQSSNANALIFYFKPGKEMLQYFRYEFKIGTETVSDLGNNVSDVYYVSAANPNNVISYTPSSKNMEPSDTSYSAYGADGYYVIVPISNFNDTIRQGINDGTCSQLILLINSIRYKNASTNQFSAAGKFDGSNLIFDDFGLISDINGYIKQMQQAYNKVNDVNKYNEILKKDNEATAYAYTGGVATIGEPIAADQFSATANTLTNTTAQTGYKLYNSLDARKVVMQATSKPSFKYGSHLKFTAPEDGIYDFGGSINVQGNADVTDATVKYRLVKIDNAGKESVITNEGNWLEMSVTSSALNPKAAFPVSQVTLKTGESVAIEAYQDSGNTDSALNISLGNPTATLVTASSNYSGSSATYKYTDYFDGAVFDVAGATFKKHEPITNRWNTASFKIDSGTTTYYTINNMRPGTSWTLLYNNNVANVAGYHYTDHKYVLKGVNVGVALEFIAPKAGKATVTLPVTSSDAGISLRILNNGTKVYPANTDWEAIPTSGGNFSTAFNVEKDASISVEVRAEDTSGNKITCQLSASPSVTLADTKDANNLDSTTFSPLWERPYKGSTYVGDCAAPEGSIWSYELLNASNGSTEKVDYYDSYSKKYYKSGDNTCGYIFNEDSFDFAFGDGTKGMALVFNTPARGYYDLSSAFKLISGTGTVKIRILRGDEQIYPAEEWATFTENLAFDAIEFGANAGDKIKVEAKVENSSNSVISMATPVIQRLSNLIYTETGNTTVYKPNDYTAFEKNFNGNFEQLASRFTYSFGDGAKVPTKANSGESKLIVDSNNYVSFGSDGAVKLLAEANSTAEINFKSVMAGNGNLSVALAAAAEIRVLKNGEVLLDWKQTDLISEAIDLEQGDNLTVQFKGTGSEIAVNSFAISLIGYHNNTNSAEDDGFYAAYADPYADEFFPDPYEGTYKRTDADFWDFAIYDAKNNQIKTSNSYSSAAGNKLYHSAYSDTAYYFGKSLLTADINAKDGYGIALGFTAPRGDTFNARYGFRIVTVGTEAKMRVRLVKATGGSGDMAQIWPSGSDWYEIDAKMGEDITIPYAELTLKVGETVYLEAYAVSANVDNFTVNLVSPAFIKDKVEKIDTSDVKANVYNAYNYAPYSYVSDYFGTYIPMDNRWNFHFATVTDSGSKFDLFNPDNIRNNNGNEYNYYSSLNSIPKFIWDLGNKTVTVKSYVDSNKNIGSSMQFNCPYDGDVLISAMPTVSNIDIEGATLKYRIVKRSIADGSTSTVWPESGEWEVIDSDTASVCANVVATVEVGDVLDFQTYWDVPADKLNAYLASSTEQYWNPAFNFSPTVTANEWINTSRTGFDTATQYTPNYLINPYWKVQYKLNATDAKWSYATRHTGSATMYWRADMESMLGASNKGVMAIQDAAGTQSIVGNDPIVAWLFTSKTDSRITMGRGMIVKVAASSAGLETAKFRVTINDKPVYGWIEIGKASNEKMVDVSFELKAGDQVRFEVKGTRPIEAGDKLLVSWKPNFSVSNEINIYSQTDDIFNMLDEYMLGVFTAMDGSAEFDEGHEANKSLSQKITDWLASVVPFDYFPSDKEKEEEQEKDQYIIVEDTYKEWTEEIYTPGEGEWHKVIRYKTTGWWVYALIIAGCVVAAGGTAVAVILIIKKKKAKNN